MTQYPTKLASCSICGEFGFVLGEDNECEHCYFAPDDDTTMACHCSEDRCHHEAEIDYVNWLEADVVTYDDLLDNHHQELMVQRTLTPSYR